MSVPTFIKTQSEVHTLRFRSLVYELLAGLLRHPSAEQHRSRLEQTAKVLSQILSRSGVQPEDKLRVALRGALAGVGAVTGAAWTSEHESCFGHTAHARVPAYELEYGEEHSHRQPQELADIAAFYQAFGLRVSQRAHERADHISTEFEFMYFLLHKTAYALDRNEEEKAAVAREASDKFLAQHLGRWAPAFALRLLKFARAHQLTFMEKAAGLVFQFVADECQAFGVETGSADLPVRSVEEREEAGCVNCKAAFGPGRGGVG